MEVVERDRERGERERKAETEVTKRKMKARQGKEEEAAEGKRICGLSERRTDLHDSLTKIRTIFLSISLSISSPKLVSGVLFNVPLQPREQPCLSWNIMHVSKNRQSCMEAVFHPPHLSWNVIDLRQLRRNPYDTPSECQY